MNEEWKRGDIVMEIGWTQKYVVEEQFGLGYFVRRLTKDGPENYASILNSTSMEMCVKVGEWDFKGNHEVHERGT